MTRYTGDKDPDDRDRDDARRDRLRRLTPSQVDQYIETQITDLASAKAFLRRLTKVVLQDLQARERRQR